MLLAQHNAGEEAESCFQQAIALARQPGSKALELRATVSLAPLWQQQGRIAEAHRQLAEVYGWFTEGFDTSDLLAAKAISMPTMRSRSHPAFAPM